MTARRSRSARSAGRRTSLWPTATDRRAERPSSLQVSNIPVHITQGAHTVTATFIERSRAESNDLTGGGRTFRIGMPIIRDGIDVKGPYRPDGLSLSASRAKIFICEPKQPSDERPCAEKIARHLASQAFRRPVTDADVASLMQFYADGRLQPGGFESGVTELITATLASPEFMYRALSGPSVPGQSLALTDLELASRLSFFLWNQGPDQQLLTLADDKQLHDPKVLDAQVARMLQDPRAESLITDFAFSWLNFGTLDQVEPLDKSYNADMTHNFADGSAPLPLERAAAEPQRERPDHGQLDIRQRFARAPVRHVGRARATVPQSDPRESGSVGTARQGRLRAENVVCRPHIARAAR